MAFFQNMRALSLSLVFVVIASIFGLGWLINTIYGHSEPDSSLGANAQTYASQSIGQHAQLKFFDHIANTLDTAENIDAFLVSWNQNKQEWPLSVFTAEELPLPDELVNQLRAGEIVLLESASELEAYRLMPRKKLILGLGIIKPTKSRGVQRFELLLTLCFYAGITSIVLIWLWPLIHRLERLRETAMKFGQGNLSVRAPVQKLSYIKDIENEFNRMADQIESLISDNKLLSRAVSHDLKTPLARLRFGLDALSETNNEKLKKKYAARVDRDLDDMESLINILLQYARLDESRVSLKKDKIRVVPLLTNTIEKYRPLGKDITFHCENDEAQIVADTSYFSMLVNNVLSNAVRHASRRVAISLSFESNERKNGTLKLAIEDDGPGIAKSDRKDVVKPFWRAESSRDNKGHGMGLAIVQRISDWHDAKLTIGKSSSLGGASITLHFDQPR